MPGLTHISFQIWKCRKNSPLQVDGNSNHIYTQGISSLRLIICACSQPHISCIFQCRQHGEGGCFMAFPGYYESPVWRSDANNHVTLHSQHVITLICWIIHVLPANGLLCAARDKQNLAVSAWATIFITLTVFIDPILLMIPWNQFCAFERL